MKKLMTSFLSIAILASIVSCKNDKAAEAITSAATETAEATGTSLAVDSTSLILWEGSKIAGTHVGTIEVSEGTVYVENGQVTGGSFTIDMTSINCTDLEGDKKAYLESHLKGSSDENADDFFNVAKYPSASFEITKVALLENDPDASHLVFGNLTLKEQTKQVGFKALIKVEGSSVSVNAPKFTIDRTQWGIKYGSDKFFDNLKDKAISDIIALQIQLTAS